MLFVDDGLQFNFIILDLLNNILLMLQYVRSGKIFQFLGICFVNDLQCQFILEFSKISFIILFLNLHNALFNFDFIFFTLLLLQK